MDHQGDWALFESSKGRKYYFNIKTQSNEWVEKSKNNVISDFPPQPNQPFPPPPPPNHELSNGSSPTSGFKMKIQNNNKRKTKTSSKNNTNSSGESKNIDENVTIPPEEKDRLPK